MKPSGLLRVAGESLFEGQTDGDFLPRLQWFYTIVRAHPGYLRICYATMLAGSYDGENVDIV